MYWHTSKQVGLCLQVTRNLIFRHITIETPCENIVIQAILLIQFIFVVY